MTKYGAEIRKISLLIEQFIREKEPALSGSRLFYLLYIKNNNGIVNQSDIVKVFNHRRSTVTSTIDCLIKDGYVSKEENTKDKRGNYIKITEKGAVALEENKKIIIELENTLVKGIPLKEIEQFMNTLDKMISNLSKKEEE